MKILKFVAAGLLALSAFPTLAADLGDIAVSREARPIRQAASPIWNGFYLGGHLGYGWGTVRAVDLPGSMDVDGFIVGGQVGANLQLPGSPLVFGVEADIAWAMIRETQQLLPFGFLTGRSNIEALGTARGRLGYSFSNILIYGTGGFAWANNELRGTVVGVPVSDKQLHTGWTAGGGVEWSLHRNWSAKIEYLFMQFGTENYFPGLLGGLRVDGDIHTIKGGVNYRFDWGGPVVARY